jgi:methionyl-tRNA formyltransferase
MSFKKVAVLTSSESWFVPYGRKFVGLLKRRGLQSKLFFDHRLIPDGFDVVFVMSYFKIIGNGFLSRHRHNLVVHESMLPRGKGWAPLAWQVLEGKDRIPVTLFEANSRTDAGDVYLRDRLILKGNELYEEIRRRQAEHTIELCLKWLRLYKRLKPLPQKGRPSFYRKRNPADHKLDIYKTIRSQFNLLRISDNENFPAFFDYRGRRYVLKIYDKDNK